MPTPYAVGGLASGIDTKAIVDSFLFSDRAPARLAERSRSKSQVHLDSLKAFNTKLLALRDQLDEQRLGTSFASKSATSSDATKLAVAASSTALTGSTVINVKTLARAEQIASFGELSNTLPLGSGTVVLRLASTPPGDPDLVISPEDSSLNGIASAINAANAGVVASVVNDGSGAPFRLLITASKTGTANAINTIQGTGALAGILPGKASMETITVADNATIRLGDKDNGLLLTSASNRFDGLIPGLTINLLATGDGLTINVANDTTGARKSLQSLVDTYNGAKSFYDGNSKYDQSSKTSGALFGDYEIRSQLNNVERELSKSISGQPEGFKTLNDIGIRLGTDGNMTIDAVTFDAKLAQNPAAVTSLIKASTAAASTSLDRLTRSTDGSMALKQAADTDRIKQLDERITKIDARLEQRKAYYQAKFLAMEKLTAQFQSQGNSLGNFITGLSNNRK